MRSNYPLKSFRFKYLRCELCIFIDSTYERICAAAHICSTATQPVVYPYLADNPRGVKIRYNAPISHRFEGALPWCRIFFSTGGAHRIRVPPWPQPQTVEAARCARRWRDAGGQGWSRAGKASAGRPCDARLRAADRLVGGRQTAWERSISFIRTQQVHGQCVEEWLIHRGEYRFFFFNVLMTVVGLIFNTRAVSRIPLPLRLMSTICSLIAGARPL